MFEEYEYVRWVIFDRTIYEGMVGSEVLACLRALCVVIPMLLFAYTVQRWKGYRNAARRK